MKRRSDLMKQYRADKTRYWKVELPVFIAIAASSGAAAYYGIGHFFPMFLDDANQLKLLMLVAMVVVGLYMLLASPYPSISMTDVLKQRVSEGQPLYVTGKLDEIAAKEHAAKVNGLLESTGKPVKVVHLPN